MECLAFDKPHFAHGRPFREEPSSYAYNEWFDQDDIFCFERFFTIFLPQSFYDIRILLAVTNFLWTSYWVHQQFVGYNTFTQLKKKHFLFRSRDMAK